MVSDLKTFTNKRCKIATQNPNCFFANFALLSRIFFLLVFFTSCNRLFAPTSWSQMSKLFWFAESLRKINEKKWSQIGKLLLKKGAKLPRWKKFFFFYRFYFICLLCLSVFLPPFPKVQSPNFLDFWNPWRQVRERSGLIFENSCL